MAKLSDILKTPPAIGGTTPAAGAFTEVSVGGAKYVATKQSVLDDGILTLPTITANCALSGEVIVSAAGVIEQSAKFEMDSTGTVQIIHGTAGVVANADTDGNLCLGTAATQNPLSVKNRLAGTKNVMITLWYA